MSVTDSSIYLVSKPGKVQPFQEYSAPIKCEKCGCEFRVLNSHRQNDIHNETYVVCPTFNCGKWCYY